MKRNRHVAARKRSFPIDKRTTREVEATRTMNNGKPFRTAAMKVVASDNAVKIEGRYVSPAPVRHHPQVKGARR